MASVNFEKLKQPQQVMAMFRHCDSDERLKHNHSNTQIDKSLTKENDVLYDLSLEEVFRKYEERIAHLDSFAGANKRKDRVTCFGLNVPVPKELDEEDYGDFFSNTLDIIGEKYGVNNVIQAYAHVDEVHTYRDENGNLADSRAHMHVYVVPEHEDKLNGKWFSSKANMVALNNAIHEMAKNEFDVEFMDGTKKKSKKTVEQLKNESAFREAVAEWNPPYGLKYMKLKQEIRHDVREHVREREQSLALQQKQLSEQQEKFRRECARERALINSDKERINNALKQVNELLADVKNIPSGNLDEQVKRYLGTIKKRCADGSVIDGNAGFENFRKQEAISAAKAKQKQIGIQRMVDECNDIQRGYRSTGYNGLDF